MTKVIEILKDQREHHRALLKILQTSNNFLLDRGPKQYSKTIKKNSKQIKKRTSLIHEINIAIKLCKEYYKSEYE